MQPFAVLSALFCVASAQLASWPASSFNPYFQGLLGPARTPVNSIAVQGQGLPGFQSVIPAPPPVAPPVYAPVPAVPAPLPFAAPALPVAAPFPFAAPVAAPLPVAAPFLAPPVVPAAPVFAAPAVPVVPRVVPAYAPFATSAMFIGSNKA